MDSNGTVTLETTEHAHNRLLALEEVIESRLGAIKSAADDIAVALYQIQQDALWMHGRDDNGTHYRTFDDYLRDLADRVGSSRSSLYDYKRMVLIAVSNKIVESPDQFREIGVTRMRRIVKGSGLNYDTRTGEIIGDGCDAAGTIREIANYLTIADLPPREEMAYIQDTVSAGNRVEIVFGAEFLQEGGVLAKWTRYVGSETPKSGYITDRGTPQDVIDLYLAKLHIRSM